MIHISAAEINKRSPYVVEEAGENSFLFTTKYGVLYTVGFVEDYSFMQEGVYQFFISNMDKKNAPMDEDIMQTVSVIIEEFFAQGDHVMLYVCDTMDGRQAIRDRLFKMWFNTYAQNTTYTLYSEQLKMDGVWYFASIMLQKNHPLHNQIISAFHDFVQDFPEKFS